MSARFELLPVVGTDALGEGPWWDAARAELMWVDIPGRRIRLSTLDGEEAPAVPTPTDVGFAVRDTGGGIVAGLADRLARLDAPGEEWTTLWAGEHDPAAVRINDGKTDRRGRVWFGTMHREETEASGSLYRASAGSTERVLGGITTSNGLGWSPDDRTMYFTDSIARTIWAFGHDPDTGALSRRRVFAVDTDCFPDGLTVDADGAVWGAKWDGGRIVRYRPDGTVDRVIELPVRKPTSVAFAGAALDVLAVTSARRAGGDGDLAGSVFLLDVGVTGIAERPAEQTISS